MIQARQQAEGYLSSLPKDHASPPFIIVCDVGRVFELYADFSGHDQHYSQFPDAHDFRIELQQLSDPHVRALLKTVSEAPHSLDPAKQTAKVTREIAGQLAEISKALETRGFDAGVVAVFLIGARKHPLSRSCSIRAKRLPRVAQPRDCRKWRNSDPPTP